MALIFESPHFIIEAAEYPFVSREEGGHIRILPKVMVHDRTELTPSLAIEYMKLSMLAGEALKIAMGKRGVKIGVVNYQDMGNWTVFKPDGPVMHMHVLGRAVDAVKQKYGEGVQIPPKYSDFYTSFKPLDDEDINAIQEEIETLLLTPKYQHFK